MKYLRSLFLSGVAASCLGGTFYGIDRIKDYKQSFLPEKQKYEKILALDNERKERHEFNDILPAKRVLEYKEKINDLEKESRKYDVFGILLSIFGVAFGGTSAFLSVASWFEESSKNRRSSSKSKKKPASPKPLELEGKVEETRPDIINPWDKDFEEIENKRY